MNRKWFTRLVYFIMVLFGIVVMQETTVYAQEVDNGEEEVSVSRVFIVPPAGGQENITAANATACEVTAELRWYRKKQVRVLYHWQHCQEPHTLTWELASIRNASGALTINSVAATQEVYDERWDELEVDDRITLYTWLDGVAQTTVETRYLDSPPVWPKIHTRQDLAGACFQFTGHNDPWGVFTAGDQRHVFFLGEKDWVTPWFAGPDTATVDWHVALYRDRALTRLRAEYSFKNVPNPCHEVEARCAGVGLSLASESPLTSAGALVTATVQGENSTAYRIVDETGTSIAGPADSPRFEFEAFPTPRAYQAQVRHGDGAWTTEGCTFHYISIADSHCAAVRLSIDNGAAIAKTGAPVDVTVVGSNATAYRLVIKGSDQAQAGPSTTPTLHFHALPDLIYQAQTRHGDGEWNADDRCAFTYIAPPPACVQVTPSIAKESIIPEAGTTITVDAIGHNATQFRVTTATGELVRPVQADGHFSFAVKPWITYQVEVADEREQWSTSPDCQLGYKAETNQAPRCEGVVLSVDNQARIPVEGATVNVKVLGKHSTRYRILREGKQALVEASSGAFTIHALPGQTYTAEVAGDQGAWVSSDACQFKFAQGEEPVATCVLGASHYGDPGGLADITAWIQGNETKVAPITQVKVNWDNHGTISYPTKGQHGPWFTNTHFQLNSRPEVHDVGFGYYRFEAWVYVEGIAEPAYCWDDGNAPDHDNVIPDPGPFAQDNPEGKFNRGSAPSRLPTVGRLPFDGGNGPERIELILWAFEKSGRGVNAQITGLANEGKPLARLGMASVKDLVKFDGLNAREGIVYGFQIGEHGPWSPLFCPPADSNPTTITVYWGAGGMTWLSDGAAYGDCWWLTVAAARQGWLTVDETVATYNALQPVIDWHGHRNLVFSLAQDKQTGLGPRMQDAVIGLKAQDWQGPVLPATMPADFQATVESYQAGP